MNILKSRIQIFFPVQTCRDIKAKIRTELIDIFLELLDIRSGTGHQLANVPFTFHIRCTCSLRIDESGVEKRVLLYAVTVRTVVKIL